MLTRGLAKGYLVAQFLKYRGPTVHILTSVVILGVSSACITIQLWYEVFIGCRTQVETQAL